MNNLNELLSEKKKIESKKWEYYQKFKNSDKIIKDLDKKIYKICVHDWEYDYSSYDGPDKICKICNLYRNEYLYR